MKKISFIMIVFLVILMILPAGLSGCSQPPATDVPTDEAVTPEQAAESTDEVTTEPPAVPEVEETTTAEAAENTDVLYVNLTWHQHQPLYYKNEDGVYTRPWVRVHATKDYLDMVETAAKYDDIQVTFNLTPTLILQLDDLANGAKDIYWVLAEKPASELTDEDKRFILQRFFDANWDNIIAVYPRYQALLDKRGGGDEASVTAAMDSFTEQDFRDLQVWFNLAWFDPAFLAEPPLAELVAKGENFTEDDKVILFDEVLRLVQAVIPAHKMYQDDQRIEVTTTPYAHPILPLIYDNQLALVAQRPTLPFSDPQDAEAHLALSVAMYEDHFGQGVRGLWPGEGSVAQAVVGRIAEAGYAFMQTGEPVLAKTLGIESFTRDSANFVQESDALYRPYYVTDEEGNQVAIFFRDGSLSDNIGFVYSGMDGEAAANDLVDHLEAVQADFQANGIAGPHIVSIILDGENAWEHYPNDGNDFLNALYQKLSASTRLETITPSNYLAMFPEQRSLDDLFPGAWFSPNYDTWIGEPEEALAWDYLAQVREDLAAYENGEKTAAPEDLTKAFDFMYLAEGSDWFWWYGADQDSGQDSYFDEGFRALLSGVYQSLGEEVPKFIDVPIIQPLPVGATRPLEAVAAPTLDGVGDDPAWETAAYYQIDDSSTVTGIYTTFDQDNLYLRIDVEGSMTGKKVGVYFSVPGFDGGSYPFSQESDLMLDFYGNLLVKWSGADSMDVYLAAKDGWRPADGESVPLFRGDGMAEFAVPLSWLGDLKSGDALKVSVVVDPEGEVLPQNGPAQILIPNLGEVTTLLQVDDPVGDDFGPGTYVYPQDAVFSESVFDVQSFEVATDGEDLIFTFDFVGPIENPWGSPNGLAVQTLDVYIDTDPGEGTGARLLLPGRNASLPEGSGWEYAVWAEGWTPQILQVDPDTLDPIEYSEATGGMKVIVDTAKNTVTVRVPLSFLSEGDPANWEYAAVVLGQEGYPTEGVWRVRNVNAIAAQWAFGGAPNDINHTRIIDMISSQDQVPFLSSYPSATGSLDSLGPDDFPQIDLLSAGD